MEGLQGEQEESELDSGGSEKPVQLTGSPFNHELECFQAERIIVPDSVWKTFSQDNRGVQSLI